MAIKVRDARPEDAARLAEIYAPNVLETPITFDETVPTPDFFEDKVATLSQSHCFLVCEVDGELLGFAYASKYREKSAYKLTTETTVYVDTNAHGRGVGSALYAALLQRLSEKNFHLAIAAITVPNDASLALHRKHGFEFVGRLSEVGNKFDEWHDVEMWQKFL